MTITMQNIHGDHRGKLIAIESGHDIPFDIKRIFFIYGTKRDIARGQHSHHLTQQYLIAVSGSCKVTLDDGKTSWTFDLSEPNSGLLQDAMIWGTMHNFSDDCVLLVLASEHYDAADYINDYEEFLALVG